MKDLHKRAMELGSIALALLSIAATQGTPDSAPIANAQTVADPLVSIEPARQWIILMRAHHVGGIEMAFAAAEVATVEKVIRLASTQVRTQALEVEQFDLLLAGEYA